MAQFNPDLKQIFYPWTFILREGKKIKKNRMDFSLMMIQTGRPQVIRNKRSKKSQKIRKPF